MRSFIADQRRLRFSMQARFDLYANSSVCQRPASVCVVDGCGYSAWARFKRKPACGKHANLRLRIENLEIFYFRVSLGLV